LGGESVSKPEVFIFPDTNVFMHFKMFDEVEWGSLVGGAPVVLGLTRTVMAELDKHKTDHRSSKKRDRVRKILNKIDAIHETADKAVRKGVRLEKFAFYPRRADVPDGLDVDRPDDCHIATVLQAVRERNLVARVVSDDGGVRDAATSFGLGALKPVDPLPAELDEHEQEARRLRSELLDLQTKSPKLDVRFRDGSAVLLASFMSIPEAQKHVLEALAEREIAVRRGNNPVAFAGGVDVAARRKGFDHQLKKHTQKRVAAATFRIDLTLHNEGRALADDIHVALTFPGRLSVTDKAPPNPDVPIEIDVYKMASVAVAMDPRWEIRDGVAEFEIGRLKQQMTSDLPSLFVRSLDFLDRTPFEIVGSIIVGEPPTEFDCKLAVKFEGRT
jgi:hypothetical protein